MRRETSSSERSAEYPGAFTQMERAINATHMGRARWVNFLKGKNFLGGKGALGRAVKRRG